jgi:hypothetical protein
MGEFVEEGEPEVVEAVVAQRQGDDRRTVG